MNQEDILTLVRILYWNIKYFNFLTFILIITLFGCEEKDAPQITFSAVAQKGPLIRGSEVIIQKLTKDLNPSGQIYLTEIDSDFGTFGLGGTISQGYYEVSATGFYYNENIGRLSQSPIRLQAFLLKENSEQQSLNILTTLAYERIQKLVRDDHISFEEAQTFAKVNVLQIFGIPEDDSIENFDFMDLTKPSNSAILLAISSIMQQGSTDAELSELTSRISDDLADDGEISEELLLLIRYKSSAVNVKTIIENLKGRYASLGLAIETPDFSEYMDSDGDGLINKFDVSEPIFQINGAHFWNEYTVVDRDAVFTITMQTITPEADIFYTLDGSTPTSQSLKYLDPIVIDEPDGTNVTVRAIAIKNGLDASDVVTRSYLIYYLQAFNPILNLWAGEYTSDINISFLKDFPTGWPDNYPEDYTVYYTTDGTTPTLLSSQVKPKLDESIIISGDNTTTTLKAIASCGKCKSSELVHSFYSINYEADLSPKVFNTIYELGQNMVGVWIGYKTPAQSSAITTNIEISFNPDGTITGSSLSPGTRYNGLDHFFNAFGWQKFSFTILNINSNGKGTSLVIEQWGTSIRQYYMTEISVTNSGMLSFVYKGAKYQLIQEK